MTSSQEKSKANNLNDMRNLVLSKLPQGQRTSQGKQAGGHLGHVLNVSGCNPQVLHEHPSRKPGSVQSPEEGGALPIQFGCQRAPIHPGTGPKGRCKHAHPHRRPRAGNAPLSEDRRARDQPKLPAGALGSL